jgi:hypothetical protein
MQPIDIPSIVGRLFRLYDHSRRRCAVAAAAKTDTAFTLPVLDTAAWLNSPIPSPLGSVTDSESAARYAAWVIGETLNFVAGRDLMDQVFDAFEAAHGGRAASWLDHRWDGVGGNVWCA